jgi:NMD protein affecting ribosome stability and mRNA decay
MSTRDVGKAAQGIDLKIMVEDHAAHLMEFMRWKVPQSSQTHKDLRI